MARKLNGMGNYGALITADIIAMPKGNYYIERCGNKPMDQFQQVMKYITEMKTGKIFAWKTFNLLQDQSILESSIADGHYGTHNSVRKAFVPTYGKIDNHEITSVNIAAPPLKAPACGQNGARGDVVAKLAAIEKPIPVYNLEIEDCHEYYANGILVHNCTWVPGEGLPSPDRMDSLVWSITALMLTGQAARDDEALPLAFGEGTTWEL